MRVLVTGGAGFIGSHLVDAYIARGDKVLIVDDFSSGSRDHLNPRASLRELSILDPEFQSLVSEFKPDLINHHAAQKSVRDSVVDPSKDADINIMGLIRVCEAAKESSCRKLIFASSGGAIYGEQDSFPADENHPTRPLSPYGISKLASEHYLRFYTQEYGFQCTALRYANVYGPRQDPAGEAGVVAIFCSRLLAGESLRIFGSGDQTRDFVYVEDIVRANIAAENLSELYSEINIGTSRESSINELASFLKEHSGSSAEIIYEARKPGEQDRSVLDAKKARHLLAWEPTISLNEGLKKTYAWFQDQTKKT